MSGDQEDHDRRFAVQRGEIMLRDIAAGPDIVDRLRGYRYDGHLLRDAADEIERLRAKDAGILGAIMLVLEGFETGVFIRDISGDHNSDWAVKALKYLRAVGQLQLYVDEANQ